MEYYISALRGCSAAQTSPKYVSSSSYSSSSSGCGGRKRDKLELTVAGMFNSDVAGFAVTDVRAHSVCTALVRPTRVRRCALVYVFTHTDAHQRT